MTLTNSKLIDDPIGGAYTLTAIVLPPKGDETLVLSLGSASLYHHPHGETKWVKLAAKHAALGVEPQVEYTPLKFTFKSNDFLILHTFAAKIQPLEVMGEMPAKKITEILLHGSEEVSKQPAAGRPLAVMCIKKLA
jgi:hypothetical protein